MKEQLLDFFNGLPKYSFTVTIDLAVVVLAVFGIVLVMTMYFTAKYLKSYLFENDDEFLAASLEMSTPVSSGKASTGASNKRNLTINPVINTGSPITSPQNGANSGSTAVPDSSTTSPPEQSNTSQNQTGTKTNPPAKNQKISFETPKSKISNLSIDHSTLTVFDLEEFMTRLFKSFFIVYRIKDGSSVSDQLKKRLMKMNDQCELIFYKNFQHKHMAKEGSAGMNEAASVHSLPTVATPNTLSSYVAIGAPYIKLPLPS